MASVPRPDDLFDREVEWEQLVGFAAQPQPGLRLAVVTGRRRHGKSYLLRRLAAGFDGLYHQARELEKPQALAEFGLDVADHLDLDPGAVRPDTWEAALRLALGLRRGAARAGRRRAAGARLLVIDELPYLLAHAPELPSVLQLLYDEAAGEPDAPPTTVILCGSSLSIMRELLTGTQPLRGRAQLEMTLPPFDFRTARRFWGIDDPQVAFEVDAILGGTPGYRQLVTAAPPTSQADVGAWVVSQVLNPASALFNEQSYLLREDPRNLDRAAFNSVLNAIAAGHHTQKAIGASVGRDHNALKHPLGVLESAGFVRRVDDVLTARRPLYFLTDPIIRFSQAVIDPHRARLEEREAADVWRSSAAAYSSQVLGPHFEHLARVWTARFSGERWGVTLGEVGPAVINDASSRSQHELDVVALERDGSRIAVIGEAKATTRQRTTADLRRLERVRALLDDDAGRAADARLALFSRTGFQESLVVEAATRPDVHLVDLGALYA